MIKVNNLNKKLKVKIKKAKLAFKDLVWIKKKETTQKVKLKYNINKIQKNK